MTNPVRYGVFSLGDLWALYAEDAMIRGFTEWHAAVSDARSLARDAMADGKAVELLVQDSRGLVTRVDVAAGP